MKQASVLQNCPSVSLEPVPGVGWELVMPCMMKLIVEDLVLDVDTVYSVADIGEHCLLNLGMRIVV